MTNRITDYFKTFLLWELLVGLRLTGKYFFARKITVQYPDEKTPMSHRYRGLHIALVDDVMTSGSTAEAAARALRVGGAKKVEVWVVARV